MSDEIKALVYFYGTMKKTLKEGKVKGLRAKGLFDFIKQVDGVKLALQKGQILDYEEVRKYVD